MSDRGGPSTEAARQRFQTIFRAHQGAVLAYAARRVDQPADAADVVAETFLVAWRRLDRVPPGSELPWLLGVARKVAANVRRGRGRRSRLADRMREELRTADPTGHGPGDPLAADVSRALSQLSAADREIITLAAWDGLTPAEIALALALSPVAARSRLHRARGRLTLRLAAMGIEISGKRTLQHRPRAGHHPSDGQPLATDARSEA